MNDTYLSQKKIILVFNNLPFDNTELRYKFTKFIEKLTFNTELRMILILPDKESNDLIAHDDSIPIM